MGNPGLEDIMRIRLVVAAVASVLMLTGFQAKTATVKGYVIDSACTFTKNLKKPISAECAQACAKAGSPLVILSGNGEIYWPIADSMPATGQNDKLLPFAGKRVVASGKIYNHGGSRAIVIEKIDAEK
jgi:hypothetical protein